MAIDTFLCFFNIQVPSMNSTAVKGNENEILGQCINRELEYYGL
jgi:hypothetical protein